MQKNKLVLFFFANLLHCLISVESFAAAKSCKVAAGGLVDSLKIAAVQYPLGEGFTESQFFSKVERYIDESVSERAELVVFPELVTTEMVNWAKNDKAQLAAMAKNFFPKYLEWLKSQAMQKKISILGGTTPRLTERGIVNTAVLAMANGEVILQDKMWLTPDEKVWGWVPGTELKIHQTQWGKMVILTCFDCEFPVLSQSLAQFQPDLILVPSWTSTQSGLNRVDWTARARAIEHFAFVVKTGTAPSENATQQHFSQASIVTPQVPGFPESPIAASLNVPGITYGSLDLKLQRELKPKTGYYPGNEQKIRTEPLNVLD